MIAAHMGEISEGFGKALRLLRERSGKTQEELGRPAAVDGGRVSDYETGKRMPGLVVLERLLSSLNADLLDLHNALAEICGGPPASRPKVSHEEALPPAGKPLDLRAHRPGDPMPHLSNEEVAAVLLDHITRHVHEQVAGEAQRQGSKLVTAQEADADDP